MAHLSTSGARLCLSVQQPTGQDAHLKRWLLLLSAPCIPPLGFVPQLSHNLVGLDLDLAVHCDVSPVEFCPSELTSCRWLCSHTSNK